VSDVVLLTLTLALLVGPGPTWAQSKELSSRFYSFAVGADLYPPTFHGVMVQASVGWPNARPGRFGVRLDVFAERFERRFATSEFKTLDVVGIRGSLLRQSKSRGTSTFYHTVGPAVYYFPRHPRAGEALRFGASAGFGFAWALHHRGGPWLSLEGSFDAIFGRDTQHVLAPLSLRIRF
jgi:hypothetical protein